MPLPWALEPFSVSVGLVVHQSHWTSRKYAVVILPIPMLSAHPIPILFLLYRAGALSRYQAGRVAAEFIASDPTRYGKLTGWHTAGINVAGSFLLGGISATPTVNVAKVNAQGAQPTRKAWQGLQGLSPRTKLMMGVG